MSVGNKLNIVHKNGKPVGPLSTQQRLSTSPARVNEERKATAQKNREAVQRAALERKSATSTGARSGAEAKPIVPTSPARVTAAAKKRVSAMRLAAEKQRETAKQHAAAKLRAATSTGARSGAAATPRAPEPSAPTSPERVRATRKEAAEMQRAKVRKAVEAQRAAAAAEVRIKPETTFKFVEQVKAAAMAVLTRP